MGDEGKSKWWNLKRRSLPVDLHKEDVKVYINELHLLIKKKEQRDQRRSEKEKAKNEASLPPTPTIEPESPDDSPKRSPTTPPTPITPPYGSSLSPLSILTRSASPTSPRFNSLSPPSILSNSRSPPHPLSRSRSPPHPLSRSRSPPHPLTRSKSPPHPLTRSKSPPHSLARSRSPPTSPQFPSSPPIVPTSPTIPSSPRDKNLKERRSSVFSVSMGSLPNVDKPRFGKEKPTALLLPTEEKKKRRGSIFSSESPISFRRGVDAYTHVVNNTDKTMLANEQTYVQGLNTVVKEFVLPLREQEILTKKEMEEIFASIESILLIHTEIIKDLQTGVAAPRAYQKLIPALKFYSIFADTEVQRWYTIGQCKIFNAIFNNFLKQALTRGHSLRKLLELPGTFLGKCVESFKQYQLESAIQGLTIQQDAKALQLQIAACQSSNLQNLEKNSNLQRFCIIYSSLTDKIKDLISGLSELVVEVPCFYQEEWHLLVLFTNFVLLLKDSGNGLELVKQSLLQDVNATSNQGDISGLKLEISFSSTPPTPMVLDFPSQLQVTHFIDLFEEHFSNNDIPAEEKREVSYLQDEVRAYRQRKNSIDSLVAFLEDKLESLQAGG